MAFICTGREYLPLSGGLVKYPSIVQPPIDINQAFMSLSLRTRLKAQKRQNHHALNDGWRFCL